MKNNLENLKLNAYLNTILRGNEPALSLIFAQLSRQIAYRRNDIIYRRGRIPDHLGYIEAGNAIAISHSKPNRKVLRFWTTNQLICPCGFFDNSPTTQSIVAIDNCLISAISYRKLFTFLNTFPQAYKIINAMLAAEISLVEMNIRSMQHNASSQNHEALLDALALSFEEEPTLFLP